MDWILELWLAELQPRLDKLWSSLDFWRALALGLLTLLAALASFREPLLRRLMRRGLAPRDRELFGRLLQVLPADGSIAFIGGADFGNASCAGKKIKALAESSKARRATSRG